MKSKFSNIFQIQHFRAPKTEKKKWCSPRLNLNTPGLCFSLDRQKQRLVKTVLRVFNMESLLQIL